MELAHPTPPVPADLRPELAALVGADGVLVSPLEMVVYECDGLTLEKAAPRLVVCPRSTEEVAAVLRVLARRGLAFIPRGAGTGLAGGTIALGAGVVVSTARMKRVLQVDLENRRIRVEAGVANLSVTRAVEAQGFCYAPDPSSQQACTIGGNIATNSGGPHTLKYGVTVDHVLALTLVRPDGTVARIEAGAPDGAGYDLVGLTVGNEGTFGIVTEVTLKLIRRAPAVRTLLAVFDSVRAATQTVSGIIARGIVPAALEMLDNPILAALNAAFGMDFPEDAAAVLLVEVDGLNAGLDRQVERIEAVCAEQGAREVRRARTEPERARLWAARKKAFGAIGRLAPNYLTQDGVVPRTKLPELIERAREIAARHGVKSVNVFHAGDGNIHPCLTYDEKVPGEVERVTLASQEILGVCLDLGGSLSGEHGIGVEKLSLMNRLFAPADLDAMRAVRAVFDPEMRSNPHKALPDHSGACVEVQPRKQAAS